MVRTRLPSLTWTSAILSIFLFTLEPRAGTPSSEQAATGLFPSCTISNLTGMR
jgi:hypothetical protein